MEEIIWKDQHLVLHYYKAVFWSEAQALLIADAHLGKVSHFRKAGMAIPNDAAFQNIARIEYLLELFKPEKLIFLGDLFHSEMNLEWMAFKNLRKRFNAVDFILVEGNHDVLHGSSYTNAGLQLTQELHMGPFSFTHDPQPHASLYNLSGHIHPGILMQGLGRQSARFPCYYFGEDHGILPAFGAFTGLHLLKPKKKDKIYLIVNEKIIAAA